MFSLEVIVPVRAGRVAEDSQGHSCSSRLSASPLLRLVPGRCWLSIVVIIVVILLLHLAVLPPTSLYVEIYLQWWLCWLRGDIPVL